jgi:hypothetical protein
VRALAVFHLELMAVFGRFAGKLVIGLINALGLVGFEDLFERIG